MFCYAQEIAVCAKNKSLYFCSDEIKLMEDPHHPHHSFLSQEQKHEEIHCKSLTHMTTLANLICFSGKSHILVNEESLTRGLIYSQSGNTTSLYLEKIFSLFNFSTGPLVN